MSRGRMAVHARQSGPQKTAPLALVFTLLGVASETRGSVLRATRLLFSPSTLFRASSMSGSLQDPPLLTKGALGTQPGIGGGLYQDSACSSSSTIASPLRISIVDIDRSGSSLWLLRELFLSPLLSPVPVGRNLSETTHIEKIRKKYSSSEMEI